MKRTTMELGGHSPVIVFDDADIDVAAEMLARFKMRNAGQVCISPTRFYVQEGAYERFLDKFVSVIGSLKVGDGLAEGVQMGPLAHERRVTAMESFVGDAVERGAKLALGGQRIGTVGNYFSPTVVTELPDDAKLMLEEPFGPIAPVTRFKTMEEALTRANSLPFGLAAYAFTNSLRTATAVSNGLEAGIVNINHFGAALPETPFGGVKDSGIGSEGGTETFDGYLVTKYITQL
jgi:succinate-semialdehyde dehydrogenase/glutarate-semialdehyde dehydrogenase